MENRIAEQIRFYRKQKGLTQEQLAEAMGVSVAAVSKWEQGQSLPEIPMLMELADFFDLSVDALLGYRLRANDRKSIVERMKLLRREDNYDEGIAEAEKALLSSLNAQTNTLYQATEKLESVLKGCDAGADMLARARYTRDQVIAAMNEVRAAGDALEGIVGKSYWPMPTYQDLLMSV